MKLARFIIMVGMIGLPSLSSAQQITAQNPDSLFSMLQAEGFPVVMKLDSVGDPLITVRYYGSSFSILFYGCKQGKDCTSVQFYSGYQTDYTLEQANAWNRNKRYSRSYVSDSGDARLEYDIHLGQDGISKDLFSDGLGLWLKTLTDFETHIDW